MSRKLIGVLRNIIISTMLPSSIERLVNKSAEAATAHAQNRTIAVFTNLELLKGLASQSTASKTPKTGRMRSHYRGLVKAGNLEGQLKLLTGQLGMFDIQICHTEAKKDQNVSNISPKRLSPRIPFVNDYKRKKLVTSHSKTTYNATDNNQSWLGGQHNPQNKQLIFVKAPYGLASHEVSPKMHSQRVSKSSNGFFGTRNVKTPLTPHEAEEFRRAQQKKQTKSSAKDTTEPIEDSQRNLINSFLYRPVKSLAIFGETKKMSLITGGLNSSTPKQQTQCRPRSGNVRISSIPMGSHFAQSNLFCKINTPRDKYIRSMRETRQISATSPVSPTEEPLGGWAILVNQGDDKI